MADPIVSIIVPTFQRPEALTHCLDSIEETVSIAREVICVMVAGDEATDDILQTRDVKVVIQPQRAGFVNAANLGLKTARGEYVMQVNDDCLLLPHSVANAIRFLEAPVHGNVGQAAFYHDSPVRRNVHSQIQLDGRWFFVCQVRGLCYANFGLTRRSLVEHLGYFDERYYMYGADPDFSLKVWHEAKMSVEPCAGALIRHLELEDERGAEERARQSEDNRLLFDKWRL